SYFDHPPLVGWIQSFFSYFLGVNSLSARIPALLATLWTLYELHIVFNLSFKNNLPFLSTLVPFSLSIFLLPDTLLLPLSLFSFRLLKKIDLSKTYASILVGIIIGACGLTKYTAIFLLPGLILAFFKNVTWQKKSHQFQENWSLWIWIKPALVITISGLVTLTPLFFWNAQHDWISFKYQYLHLHGEKHFNVLTFLKSLSMQWLGYGIILVPAMVAIILVTLLQLKSSLVQPLKSPWSNPLFLSALVMSAYFVHRSFYTTTLPHWPLLPWYFFWAITFEKISNRLKKIQFTINFTILTLIVLIIWLPVDMKHMINLKEVKGWPQLLSYLDNNINPDFNIFFSNWSYGSRANLYASSNARERLFILDARFDQFDIWEQKKIRDKMKPGYLVQFPEDSINWEELPFKCQLSSQLNEISDTKFKKWKHQFYLHFCEPK
ncbi:MAG: glycosyltransferase family 39 protein, partial [Bdellovibrionaceae bacterium]|nr:glycosyltransferase family 39 protein [Pseudobdellovibrionaceae bacterium]